MARLSLDQRDLLAVVTFLALACWAVPGTFASALWFALAPEGWWHHYDTGAAEYLKRSVLVFFGLVLVLASPQRHGLRVGSINRAWSWVIGFWVMVLAIWWPIVAAFRLSLAPDSTAAMWAISPLGQDLVFAGFLYTRFEEAFPSHVSPRIPIRRTVLLPRSSSPSTMYRTCFMAGSSGWGCSH